MPRLALAGRGIVFAGSRNIHALRRFPGRVLPIYSFRQLRMRLIQGLASWNRRFLTVIAGCLAVTFASAQVTVAISDVTTSVGQEVTVPILLTGVEGSSVTAFQLTVTSSDPNVVFTGHDATGTLTSSFTVNSNPGNGRVGGFTSSANAFTASGTLIFIKLRADAAVSSTITLVDFRLNAGVPTHTPATPSFVFDASGGGGGNNAPVASDVAVSTSEDTSVNVSLSATDADSDPLTYAVIAGPSNGSLGAVSGNQVTYTPDGAFTGSDTFTYRANDGGANSNTATVTITVNAGGGGNNEPNANGDTYSTDEDTPLTELAPGVLGNDSDAQNDPLTAIVETTPDNGTLALAANGSFVYIPDSNYSGADTFTYVANDGKVDSAPATVTITVNAVNDPPVAQSFSVGTGLGVALDIDLLATDAENDALTFSILAPPLTGSLSAVSGNSVTYTPNPGFSGSDNFVYKANDGSDDSNNATVTITVTGNRGPAIEDDTYSVDEDNLLGVPAPGVLGNDTDPDGDPLTVTLVADVQNGTLVLSPDGSFLYDPIQDYFGQDTFAYQATDGSLTSPTAFVTITVNPTGSARLQVIVSAPDATVDPANVYLAGNLFLFNSPYQSSSAFVEHPDGTIDVALAPGGSSLGSAVATFSVQLDEGGSYVLIVGGTATSGYQLISVPNAMESTAPDRFEAFFAQNSPDMPTVDIVNVSDDLNNPEEVTLLAGATFGDFTSYLPNVPGPFNFAVRTAGGSELDVFRLDLSGGGSVAYAAVVSGLLSHGKVTGLYQPSLVAYDASGGKVTASVVTSFEDPSDLVPKTFLLRGNYPNPFNPRTTVQFDLPEAAEVEVRVTDLLGREVLSVPAQPMSAGTNLGIPLDGSELASGIYIVRIQARTARDLFVATGTMTLIK